MVITRKAKSSAQSDSSTDIGKLSIRRKGLTSDFRIRSKLAKGYDGPVEASDTEEHTSGSDCQA